MVSVFKSGLYLTLSIIFIILMIDAMSNLQSEQSGFALSKEKGTQKMPSFTLCPWLKDKGLKYDNVMEFMNIKNVIKAFMKVRVTRSFKIK